MKKEEYQKIQDKVNKIVEKYQKKFDSLKTQKDTIERVFENFTLLGDMNYEIIKAGGQYIPISTESLTGFLLVAIKELKNLKNVYEKAKS